MSRLHKLIEKNIQKVFLLVPKLKSDIVVYRGINLKKAPQKEIEDYGFMSTSYDKEVALKFLENECCLLVIRVSKGTKVLPLEEISVFPGEKEILLPPGTLKIVSKYYDHTIKHQVVRAEFEPEVKKDDKILVYKRIAKEINKKIFKGDDEKLAEKEIDRAIGQLNIHESQKKAAKRFFMKKYQSKKRKRNPTMLDNIWNTVVGTVKFLFEE